MSKNPPSFRSICRSANRAVRENAWGDTNESAYRTAAETLLGDTHLQDRFDWMLIAALKFKVFPPRFREAVNAALRALQPAIEAKTRVNKATRIGPIGGAR